MKRTYDGTAGNVKPAVLFVRKPDETRRAIVRTNITPIVIIRYRYTRHRLHDIRDVNRVIENVRALMGLAYERHGGGVRDNSREFV